MIIAHSSKIAITSDMPSCSASDSIAPNATAPRGFVALHYPDRMLLRGDYCLVKKDRPNGLPAWTVGRSIGQPVFEVVFCDAHPSYAYASLTLSPGRGNEI